MQVYLSGCYSRYITWDVHLYGQLTSLLLAQGHEVLMPYVSTQQELAMGIDAHKKFLAFREECDG